MKVDLAAVRLLAFRQAIHTSQADGFSGVGTSRLRGPVLRSACCIDRNTFRRALTAETLRLKEAPMPGLPRPRAIISRRRRSSSSVQGRRFLVSILFTARSLSREKGLMPQMVPWLKHSVHTNAPPERSSYSKSQLTPPPKHDPLPPMKAA
jgi:hypothetical protein